MSKAYIIQGFIAGFSVAMPIGPVCILCIRKTLSKGRIAGLASALGAACADTIFGLTAGFGLGYISNFLAQYEFHLRLFGAVILLLLAMKVFRSNIKFEQSKLSAQSIFKDYISTMGLTLTNPMTLLPFMVFFANFAKINSAGLSNYSIFALVAGIFIGAMTWMFIICEFTNYFRTRINARLFRIINKSSGVIIALFASSIFIGFLV